MAALLKVRRWTSGSGRGRPREDRERKKRVSLSVMPSLYEDIQRIAYVQRQSVSALLSAMMEEYKIRHSKELAEYEEIRKGK